MVVKFRMEKLHICCIVIYYFNYSAEAEQQQKWHCMWPKWRQVDGPTWMSLTVLLYVLNINVFSCN